MSTTYDVVIGVDPGYRDTGIVILRGGNIVALCTVHRDEPAPVGTSLTAGDYLADVTETIEAQLARAEIHADDVDLVAVEDVVTPSPHMGTTNPTGIIGTALTVGYVASWAREHDYPVVMVRPGKNGSGPSGIYPPELLDRGGIARPGGARRHERSALDVARCFGGYRV